MSPLGSTEAECKHGGFAAQPLSKLASNEYNGAK